MKSGKSSNGRLGERAAVFGGLILLAIAGFVASRWSVERAAPVTSDADSIASRESEEGRGTDDRTSMPFRAIATPSKSENPSHGRADPRDILAAAAEEGNPKDRDRAVREERQRELSRRLATEKVFRTSSGRAWMVREDIESIPLEEARERGVVGAEGSIAIAGRVIVPRTADSNAGETRSESVVEDARTGRLGILTGSVITRLRRWEDRDAFLTRISAVVRDQAPGIRMLVLRPAGGADLSDFADVIRADRAVQSAEIEIIERHLEAK